MGGRTLLVCSAGPVPQLGAPAQQARVESVVPPAATRGQHRTAGEAAPASPAENGRR